MYLHHLPHNHHASISWVLFFLPPPTLPIPRPIHSSLYQNLLSLIIPGTTTTNVTNKRTYFYLCKTEMILHNNIPKVSGVLGTRQEQAETEHSTEGLVGLSNTCYMNSAIQYLSNTPALTRSFLSCLDLVPRDVKPAMGQTYRKLMVDLWQSEGQSHGYVAPNGVLYSIKQASPAFRGFQQHDAQEFIRCCMDQLHKELIEPMVGEEMMGKSSMRL